MFTCRGNCKTVFKNILGKPNLRYQNNQKRCGVCEIYLKIDSPKCPCCKSILHVRPRHSKAKIKYYEARGVKWL